MVFGPLHHVHRLALPQGPGAPGRRYRQPGTGGQSRADTLIVAGLFVGFIAWIALPPLDARRFGWTPRLPLWLEAGGGVLLLGAAFLLLRSFTDNTFLSPLVRVQTERRQQVVSTGVYGFVRHPMYLGATLMFVGGPLLLGSAFGMLVGLALVLLIDVAYRRRGRAPRARARGLRGVPRQGALPLDSARLVSPPGGPEGPRMAREADSPSFRGIPAPPRPLSPRAAGEVVPKKKTIPTGYVGPVPVRDPCGPSGTLACRRERGCLRWSCCRAGHGVGPSTTTTWEVDSARRRPALAPRSAIG